MQQRSTLFGFKMLWLLIFWPLLMACKPAQDKSSAAEVSPWPAVTNETKPWTRWWWMGSAVDQKNLDTLLEQYAQAGFGGVEITPIYGAVGFEDHYLKYLSPEWLNMLNFSVHKASEVGMGVDMSNGTGWPFGGPHVSPEYAATRFFIEKYSLKKGEKIREPLSVKDKKKVNEHGVKIEAVTAYNGSGEGVDITNKIDDKGMLQWSPQDGEWNLYVLFSGKTGQKVKRSAPGGEGLTLDHLSADAVNAYLARFDQAFQQKAPGLRTFFNDSYEVYGADWSPAFFAEFQKRRGYDLKLYLRELASEEKTDKVARIKSDYRQTMGEMLLENFTLPWTNWAHSQKAKTRNQAHGSPANLLDLYAAVDTPECETFGSSYFPIPGLRRDSADVRNVDPDPIMLKFASSGAHVTGKKLVSSETFTWLAEHFKVSLSQCKPEVEQIFLSGVNHVFYHGTTYSPIEAGWPGWLFYASVNFAPSNTFWPHLQGLNDYITRCQSVLQAGKPDNEILLYWPVYDQWHNSQKLDMPFTIHHIDNWLHPTPMYKLATQLQDQGYAFDFVSDKLLGQMQMNNGEITTSSSAAAYKVIIVPECTYMPLATLQKIIDLANNGALVIMQALPKDVPGYHNLPERQKDLQSIIKTLSAGVSDGGFPTVKTGKGRIIVIKDIDKALVYNQLLRESLVDAGLKYIRRNVGDGKYYYIVNHTSNTINSAVPINAKAASVTILDPQTGDYGLASISSKDNETLVKLQLKPGEAVILQTSNQAKNIANWKYYNPDGSPTEIKGEWTVKFISGGPTLPAETKTSTLQSWTTFSNAAANFSGTARYSVDFNLAEKSADEYLLELSKVGESAKVWINGQEVAILWAFPFEVKIGKYLRKGQNHIDIEVANLMANRIRYMDQNKKEWRKYHEINFVNIDYKPFDASGWQPMPSGLMGPVIIKPLKESKQ